MNAALGAAFVLVADASWGQTETPADRAVRILRDVCAKATEPEQKLQSAYAMAENEGWKLLIAGPGPPPIMHGENGPKWSDFAVWDMSAGSGPQQKFFVSVINHERKYREQPLSPPLVYDVCVVDLPAVTDAAEIDRAIDAGFGREVEKDLPPRYITPTWFFADLKAKGDCGKAISALGNGRPPRLDTLMYFEVEFRPGAPPVPGLNTCPSATSAP